MLFSGKSYRCVYFYHGDHLGSSNYITDEKGNVFEHVLYLPYGELWIDEGHDTSLLPYKFTGHLFDDETGYYYAGARYLDSKFGTWISTDPILADYLPTGLQLYFPDNTFNANSLKGSGGIYNSININLYHYGSCNPVKYIDPDGNEDVCPSCHDDKNSRQFAKEYNNIEDKVKNRKDNHASLSEQKSSASENPALNKDARSKMNAMQAFGESMEPMEPMSAEDKAGLISMLAPGSGLYSRLAKTTVHGLERLVGSTTRGGVLSKLERVLAKLFGERFVSTKNGSTAFVQDIGNGKFNILIQGEGGYMTSMKHVPLKRVEKLSTNYGWTPK